MRRFSARHLENIHIGLWLVKDTFWLLEWKTPAMLMIVPTVSMAVWIAWQTRSKAVILLPNLSVLFWISANATWMLSEFYDLLPLRHIALVFFLLGIALYLSYAIAVRKVKKNGTHKL